MSRISEIILRARDTLADKNGDRWPTDRLLRLVDEAQKEICRRAKLLRATVDIDIIEGEPIYKMPEDFLLLDKVIFRDTALEFKGHDKMDDSVNPAWIKHKGIPTTVIFDKMDRGYFRLYPIPGEQEGLQDYSFIAGITGEDKTYVMANVFGVLVGGKDNRDPDVFGITENIYEMFPQVSDACEEDQLEFTEIPFVSEDIFGVVSDISYSIQEIGLSDKRYGVTVNIEEFTSSSRLGILSDIDDSDDVEFYTKDKFGIMTGIEETAEIMTIYYLKKPEDIVDIEQELEIDNSFDRAIKYYITGKALRDDMDAQNRQVGNEELSFFEREMHHAERDDALDFTRNQNKQFTTGYQGGF